MTLVRFARPTSRGLWLMATALAALPAPAAAHGMGERYTLPLPLDLYLVGAAAAVALSFVVMAAFLRGAGKAERRPTPALTLLPAGPRPGWARAVEALIRTLGTALFVLIVAAGFFGAQDPFKNPAPVMIWVIGWVGVAYVCALIGNLWYLINPWDSLYRLVERMAPALTRPRRAYPDAWGVWPTVVLFLGFAWMELVWPLRDHPTDLARAICIYSVVTFIGMGVFGRETWRRHGEVISVVFGLLSRFAIIGPRPNGRAPEDDEEPAAEDERPEIVLRAPATGLLLARPVSRSEAAFVLLLLASVTYDGIMETPPWVDFSRWAIDTAFLKAVAAGAGTSPYVALSTVGLFVFPLLFAGLFLSTAAAMAAVTRSFGYGDDGSQASTGEIARLFVYSLVPIAIGYHLAHYMSFLVTAGQFMIPIASDPFDLGWNLFGTKLYFMKLGLVDARAMWYGALLLIVAGHVIAVWLAHVEAEHRFAEPRRAMASQYPMLILMVAYTAISLWILAQPITDPPA